MTADVRTILSIGNNAEHVNNLAVQLRNGNGLTPFVGAGMSAQLKLLEWGAFLVATARIDEILLDVRMPDVPGSKG